MYFIVEYFVIALIRALRAHLPPREGKHMIELVHLRTADTSGIAFLHKDLPLGEGVTVGDG